MTVKLRGVSDRRKPFCLPRRLKDTQNQPIFQEAASGDDWCLGAALHHPKRNNHLLKTQNRGHRGLLNSAESHLNSTDFSSGGLTDLLLVWSRFAPPKKDTTDSKIPSFSEIEASKLAVRERILGHFFRHSLQSTYELQRLYGPLFQQPYVQPSSISLRGLSLRLTAPKNGLHFHPHELLRHPSVILFWSQQPLATSVPLSPNTSTVPLAPDLDAPRFAL